MSIDGKVMVIGASGQIGYRVCAQLRERGATVYGAARFSDPDTRKALEDMGVTTYKYEVKTGDPAELPEVDMVILEVWDPKRHGGPEGYNEIWSLNYTGVGRIVSRYAGRADIVNGCSGNVYGTGEHAWRETDAPRPDSEYGLARFAQEKLIDFFAGEAGSRAVHLRYYHSNTPDFGYIHRFATRIVQGKSLGDTPDAYVRVIGMQDFVRCTVEAAARIEQMPHVVNIAHPTCWTHRTLAERIQRGLGTGEVVFDAAAGGRARSGYCDPSLMVETFGQPREDLEDLIDRVCAQVLRERG